MHNPVSPHTLQHAVDLLTQLRNNEGNPAKIETLSAAIALVQWVIGNDRTDNRN